MSLRLHAGPVTSPRQCDHGGPTLPSDPDDVSLVTRCDSEGAVHTPWPNGNVVGTVVLCEWHFARLLDANSAEFETTLRERFAEQGECLDDHLPEHALLHLADAPPALEKLDRKWYRLGLDQRGRAHYQSQAGGTILVVDGSLDVEQVQALDTRTRESWLEFVRLTCGWAEFDPDRVEFYPRGEA